MAIDDVTLNALTRAAEHARAHLEGLDQSSVAATVDLAELRKRLGRPLENAGVPAIEVIDSLVADVEGGLMRAQGGRFFGWVTGGVTPAALAADWLTSAWDQNAALYACSPAAAVTEEVVGAWVKDLLGLPASASFALTTGTQMSHVTCLAAARHSLLAARGWDVDSRGLLGAAPIRVLASSETHGSVMRALRLLGIGSNAVHCIPVHERGWLQPSALAEALAAHDGQPLVVVLQAGDLNIGAFDPFEELIPLAHARGAWVHIDGAFGLWAAASPAYKRLLRGVERADSWATDGHKWLNVPYDSGFAFVAKANDHRAALSHRALYLTHDGEARDQIDWNPEWSRRARAFTAYAALRELGRHGVADLIDRCCKHAATLVTEIGKLPGGAVLWHPTLNQGLVRFRAGRKSSVAEDDRRTDEVIAAVLATGEAFFSGTTWRNRRAMRVSVCNWRTTADDVVRSVATVEKALAGLSLGEEAQDRQRLPSDWPVEPWASMGMPPVDQW